VDRVIEIGRRMQPLDAVGDWFVRIQDGSRPADYVEFRTQEQAQHYAHELVNEFSPMFDLAEG
jgi:hypothetical protein